MSRYQFELATRADDAELRSVLAETPMDGEISVSFRRDPSYFDAEVVHGGFCQTIVGRDGEAGAIVGVGVRSVRTMFVNGEPLSVGYLSNLRVRPAYRSLGLLARGYSYFRRLHQDSRTRLYLTTVAEGNAAALSVLTSGRAGLPPYHFAGRYITAAIPLRHRNLSRRSADVEIRPAAADDLPMLLRFWETVGRRRQFFPCYTADDFFRPGSTFRDLSPENLLLAFRAGALTGTLGCWDQSGFRQSVVERYSAKLTWARPLYNGWAAARGRAQLPPVGAKFRYAVAAVPVIENDDAAVFDALLHAAVDRLAGGALRHLLVGLHERDPLLPVAERHAAARYVTRLYYVCWPDGEALRSDLDDRVPYLELGTL